MKNLKIAVAQFEPKDGDKNYNLAVIENLTVRAKTAGAELISFHELSITAYTHLKNLSKPELGLLAEFIPDGESTHRLTQIARKYQITILAGLVEREEDRFYNTYICVDDSGLVAKYRKIHPFIHPNLSPGNHYVVFKLQGWKCGILICYDNNVIENVRATCLLGADIIFAPHVTMCTPSSMPGRGFVDDGLWQNRHTHPEDLRKEFDSLKGREWLMRWLPSRAFDNGVYYIFTNPIGYDGEHLKNGNSMVLDPFGGILTEIKSYEDSFSIATLNPKKLNLAGGKRYINARKPELYREIISANHNPNTLPYWMEKYPKSH